MSNSRSFDLNIGYNVGEYDHDSTDGGSPNSVEGGGYIDLDDETDVDEANFNLDDEADVNEANFGHEDGVNDDQVDDVDGGIGICESNLEESHAKVECTRGEER